jgi:ketosteroid isomerase-like protein
MKRAKWIALAVAGALVLAGCAKKVDTAAVADSMKRDLGDWATAYNTGDAAKIAAMYATDGILMPPNAPAATGADAIRQFITDDSARAKSAGLTLAIEPTSSGVSGDLAWQSGTYSVKDASGNAVDVGKFVDLRRNVDGKWMITRDIWNSDNPPPAPAEAPPADAAATTPPSS